MRLQPPKNEDYFIGKKATRETIIPYIGAHRLLCQGCETTVTEYLYLHQDLTLKEVYAFLSMFPLDLKEMGRLYLSHAFPQYSSELKERSIKDGDYVPFCD